MTVIFTHLVVFFNYNKISVGVLVTRSNKLDPWFVSLGEYKDRNGKTRAYKAKFGASTTHMGKLLPRLKAGRNGGCPVLVFGITPELVRGEARMSKKATNGAGKDLLKSIGKKKYATILADPPWQFVNRTGKMAPEHKRLARYSTMKLDEIMELPVANIADEPAHLYLWVPNALLGEGMAVMAAWGFTYKTNLIWHKVRKDGGPGWSGRGLLFSQHNGNGLIWCAR